MKKILSLILAIIMIVATMPMSFATEFDQEAFIDAAIKAWAYTYNLYESDEMSSSKEKAWANMIYLSSTLVAVMNEYPQLQIESSIKVEPQILKENPEAGNALTVAYQEMIKYYESQIASGTFIVQIDTSEYMLAMYLPIVTFGAKKVDELTAKVPAEMANRAREADVNYSNLLTLEENTSGYTQEQFDSDVAFAKEYWNLVYNCLDGKHSIGNNSITNNNDGTHSYVCYFCTESATEEHSYIDGKCVCGEETVINNDGETEDNNNNKEENNNSEPENTNFIKRIIQKISDFFKNFFERLAEFFKR